MFESKVSINTDVKSVKEFLDSRYIENIFPSKERAKEIFMSGKRLTFYFGIDPTGPDIHLGNSTNLLLIKKLINLGHKVILLIGDFTASIGDPTGKESARKPLTEKEVRDNMKSYLNQVYKVLPKGSFEVKYNSSWLSRMAFQEVVELASHVTVQQMLQRDMFQRRLWKWKCPKCGGVQRSPIQFRTQEIYETTKTERNTITCPNCGEVPYEKEDIFSEPIFLNEFLYPLMQGYDSVAMNIDGEIGGNDQTFNMLVGRDLVKNLLKKEKIVIATKLLEDPATGKKLMNKSEGRYVSLNDSSEDMFGKIMAMTDSVILPLYEYATEVSDEKISEARTRIEKGENPKLVKQELSFELVRMYHGEKEAQKAKDEWERVFSKGEYPSEIEKVESNKLVELVGSVMGSSSSSAKILIDQGAVRVNGEAKKEWSFIPQEGDIIQIGSKKFVKIK